MSVLAELRAATKLQADLHSMDPVPVYDYDTILIARVRTILVNLNVDEDQEEFLLSNLKSNDPIIVEIPAHIVTHLIEYLQGAL